MLQGGKTQVEQSYLVWFVSSPTVHLSQNLSDSILDPRRRLQHSKPAKALLSKTMKSFSFLVKSQRHRSPTPLQLLRVSLPGECRISDLLYPVASVPVMSLDSPRSVTIYVSTVKAAGAIGGLTSLKYTQCSRLAQYI